MIYYMVNETFGKFVWRKRATLGLSRVEFANRLHISASHLNNIERGTRFPSRELVIVFSRELNEPSDNLFSLLVGQVEQENIIDYNRNLSSNNTSDIPEEPEYLSFLSVDPNLPESERETMADIIRQRYAQARKNAEELRKIPPGINRPANKPKPE